MAKKKAPEPARAKAKKPIKQYTHEGEKRANNPPVGLVTPETDLDGKAKTYAYDPHLDPQLTWAGKAEHTSFEVPTVSLHVHERIDPLTIIEAVKRKNGATEQMSLFSSAAENPPLREAIEFYKHKHGWSNRLIAGDSLLVMNSLLEKEGMAGQVQMIYIDPPYGIRYKSNFQPFVNQREMADSDRDVDLTQEPETITAFRDTWRIGIHSYLGFLRDRLFLARDLLHESGSIFVQISDENLHLIRNVLDEVFGVKCFVVAIPVKKKGAQKSGLMDPVNDYLIWYTRSPRDDRLVKFRPLFVKRELDADSLREFKTVELPDGREILVTALRDPEDKERDYRLNPNQIFRDYPGARLFRSNPLTSGGERKNQSLPYRFAGRIFTPGSGNCWKTTVQTEDGSVPGMERLEIARRLIAGAGQLRFKSYFDDFGYSPLSNWWDGLGGAPDPIYVVQTNPEIIQRCILMTTDPGDLVLDPTCGSGTTAVVAEQWGRRWITCDSSRVALTLAKQRLMTAGFAYYELTHPDEGISSGLRCKTARHVMLSDIANCADIKPGIDPRRIPELVTRVATPEPLHDDAVVDSSRHRVTGPFTVEAVPAPTVLSLNALEEAPSSGESIARSGETLRINEWRDELLKTGVRARGGEKIDFSRIEPFAGTRWLHADGETKEARPRRVVVSFGPAHAPLEQRQVALAIEEAQSLAPKPTLVLFCSFQFDPEAAKDIEETKWPGVTLVKVQMNTDLLTEDLKKKRSSNESFWLVGQPDVTLIKLAKGEDKGKFQVEVQGFDYYNPKTGTIESGGPERVALWMLDTDYDGRSLFPRQVFFPLAGEDGGWAKLARNLKAEIDEEKIEAYRGTVSLPFEGGKYGRVAVKIVDDRGIESLKLIDLS